MPIILLAIVRTLAEHFRVTPKHILSDVFFYYAYSKVIQSPLELIGFQATDKQKTDILIQKKIVDRTGIERTDKVKAEQISSGVQFTCPFGVRYEITNGNKIFLISSQESDLQLEILPLYGFSLAAVLQQRNHFVLHASSVDIAGRKVVLLGGKTEGKSTLAMSLLCRGHRLIADDITSFLFESSTIKIFPGISAMKLWPDTMKFFGMAPSCYPELYPGSEKRNYIVDRKSFCSTEGEVETIFILERATRIEAKELSGAEKIAWLMSGHYLSRFENAMSRDDKEKAFQQCSVVSRNVRVVRLSRPIGFQYIANTGELIENIVLTA